MMRSFLILSALSAALVSVPIQSADAAGFGRGGFGRGGCGFGKGIGFGIGFGGYNDICGYAELYRQLYNNLPFYALHPPVYYSYPVPRTYGYSPFAYPPDVMTPDILGVVEPVEIINPHMEQSEVKPTSSEKSDRSAATSTHVEPLVVVNPFVTPFETVAQGDR